MKDIIRDDIKLLLYKLGQSPAVAILGARQVGKTTLARQAGDAVAKKYIYMDMESSSDLALIGDSPEDYLQYHQDKLIIIDEVQAYPILYSRLRGLIDKNRVNGRFLLLGSVSPGLVKGVSESLAGRISYLDLYPFKLNEIIDQYNIQKHWFRGGFPRAFLAATDYDCTEWMQGFTRSYIERDLSSLFGVNLNSEINRRLWMMLAHHHSQLFNAEELSRSLGVTAPVVHKYVDYMIGAFLIYKLQPWYINSGKRLSKAPKIYLRDSGILHYMHRIQDIDALMSHPIVGASWEGYVIDQIIYHKPAGIDVYYYRTYSGTEVDAVLVKGNIPIASVEVKLSNAPTIPKGFYIGINDLQTTHNYVITPHADLYPAKNAWVCNLAHFICKVLPNL
ncbi:MAG: ATP-binding protein [Cytophagales bacterium]|nr:ATP-binding protein [Cytophagales bacterium]